MVKNADSDSDPSYTLYQLRISEQVAFSLYTCSLLWNRYLVMLTM